MLHVAWLAALLAASPSFAPGRVRSPAPPVASTAAPACTRVAAHRARGPGLAALPQKAAALAPPVVHPFWPRAFPDAGCGPHSTWAATLGLFAAGAAGAFVAHELGHVAANLLAGNVPRLVGLRGTAGVPFFAISPDVTCQRGRCVGAAGQKLRGGPRTPYLIAAAGFNVQHLGNEVLLSQAPALRARRGAFGRGWLAFNLLLSVGYAAASLAHVEDPHGDAGGLASYAHVPRGVVAAALLVPAALDAWRFVRPQDRWAPWASRAGKLGILGLAWRC